MVPAAALDAVLRGYWAAVTLLCCAAFAAPRGRRAQRTWHMLVCPRATYASRCSGLRALLTSCAARGKLVSSQPSAAAPRWLWRAIHLHVPHSWFAHFYVLGCVCNGAVLLRRLTCLQLHGPQAADSRGSLLAQLLFQLHVLRRLAESARGVRHSSGALMHAGGYLFGMTYYIAASLSWMPATETMQLFTQHSACSFDGIRASALPDLLCSTPAVVGAAIFAVGTRHQAKCHSILAELKAARQSGSRARYGVPRGDWFEFSSCAHYLAEIVIYLGLTVICSGSTTAVLLLVAVVANLQLAATLTHAWYLNSVPNYPRTRSALWPSWPGANGRA